MADYDEKAENAIDYEDFDEEYDGPEIEAATEEDRLLPKKEYFTADVSSALEPKSSVFDDENYDEDEESEKEQEVVGKHTQVQTALSAVTLLNCSIFWFGNYQLFPFYVFYCGMCFSWHPCQGILGQVLLWHLSPSTVFFMIKNLFFFILFFV